MYFFEMQNYINKHIQNWESITKNVADNYQQALQFGAWGAFGGSIGSLLSEPIMSGWDRNSGASFFVVAIAVGIWFGIIGASICVTLLFGYSSYLKHGFRVRQSIKAGIVPGFLAGFLAGAIAQGIYTTIGTNEVLRVICWGIAGGLLGFRLSFHIPNLYRWRGLAGGTIGGVIGGCLFILFTLLTGVVAGRLLRLATIGFFIRLTIILIEAVFREAWLIVHWTPIEQTKISLGEQPVILGSSDEAHIYLRKEQDYPPITAKIY